MENQNTQPDTTGQEADNNPVAKLGLDQDGLKGLLDSFLYEEEQPAPAPVEQKDEPEAADPSNEEVDDAEEDSDQPDADESSLSKGVQKRINKLVAAKKAAQAELDAQKATLAQLQAELESVKSSTPVSAPSVSEFVSTLDTPKKVEDEYAKTLDVILWCEDNADGGVIPMPDGQEHELTAAEVRSMKRVAMKRKEIELPQRMAYLQQQGAAELQVIKDFPWYNNPASEEYQFSNQVVRDFPEIKRRPDWKHVVGLLTLGAKAYTEMKSKKPAAPIKKAPAQPTVKAAPAQASQNDLIRARQNFAKNSSDKQGLTDLVKAMGFV